MIAKNASNLRRELPSILEDAGNELTVMARQIFNELYDDLRAREERIAQVERSIRTLGSHHEVVRRLETVPGIGYLSATALFGTVGDAKQYKNGRQLAAGWGWCLGNPRAAVNHDYSALPSAATNTYESSWSTGPARLRRERNTNRSPQYHWLNELRVRRGKFRSYVAQANKTARIAWVIMAKGEKYRASTATPETSVAVAA